MWLDGGHAERETRVFTFTFRPICRRLGNLTRVACPEQFVAAEMGR